MEAKQEQAMVGLFVLVATGLLIVTVFLLSGAFSRSGIPYRAYFKNAGGLGPGTQVRYAGGPPVGRVKKVASDPQDPARMEIDFDVQPDVPVKTDSVAEIASTTLKPSMILPRNPGVGSFDEIDGSPTRFDNPTTKPPSSFQMPAGPGTQVSGSDAEN